METLVKNFNKINKRLNQMELDIKKLKMELDIKNLKGIQSKRMTIKQSKPSHIKMTNSAPERIITDAERRSKTIKTLKQALDELGFEESLKDDRNIRDGREKSSETEEKKHHPHYK